MGLKKNIARYILTVFLVAPLILDVASAQTSGMSDGYNLLKAVKDKDYGLVRNMLQKGANVNTRDYDDGATPLYLAASMKDVVLVTFLLNSQAKTDLAVKSSGETPLMAAVRLKSRDIVNMLISQKADLNRQDRNGETALHKAVLTRDRAMVKILLAADADWSLTDNTGRTPLDIAREGSRYQTVKRVLESGGAEY